MLSYAQIDDYSVNTYIRKLSDHEVAWCTLCNKDMK